MFNDRYLLSEEEPRLDTSFFNMLKGLEQTKDKLGIICAACMVNLYLIRVSQPEYISRMHPEIIQVMKRLTDLAGCNITTSAFLGIHPTKPVEKILPKEINKFKPYFEINGSNIDSVNERRELAAIGLAGWSIYINQLGHDLPDCWIEVMDKIEHKLEMPATYQNLANLL